MIACTQPPAPQVMRVAMKMFVVLAALACACALVSSAKFDPSSLDSSLFDTGASGPLRFSEEQILRFLEVGSSGRNFGDLDPIDRDLPRGEKFAAMRRAFIKRVELEAKSLLLGGGNPADYVESMPGDPDAAEYPYWGFIPVFEGGVTPQTALDWSPPTSGSQAGCFAKNTASLAPNGEAYTLTIASSGAASANCSDFYLFATVDGLSFQTISAAGSVTLPWSLAPNSPPSHLWDLENKGVRVFRFLGNVWQMLETIVNTALLFEAQLTQGVSTPAALRNIEFLSKYANVQTMAPRNLTGGVQPFVPESEIQSGDFFGLMRLDGLDPMLAWAMGSTTGHATTALWMGGQLYVCESTVKAPHWPVNGIQKTPYRTWLAQVNAAGQGAVHAPLGAEARANFNETAAVEFFLQHEGMDYGYHTLLWGWLDTISDNYPCLPPDFEICLNWETFEVVFGLIDQFLPSFGQMMFNEAFNHRLGTQGLTAADLFQETVAQGYAPAELPTIVEQDEWIYNMTRYGQVYPGNSMVCCVFVCGVWKAAGVFGNFTDSVQCGELTNWDDYSMSILDAPTRPPQCVAADPENELCQLEGVYSVILNNYASHGAYPNMAQQCPSKAPNYEKPSDC